MEGSAVAAFLALHDMCDFDNFSNFEFIYHPFHSKLVNIYIILTIVRKRGSERTEAGESALPAEESPSAGTGRAQTLRNLQENIIDFIMGAGGETSLYLPWS